MNTDAIYAIIALITMILVIALLGYSFFRKSIKSSDFKSKPSVDEATRIIEYLQEARTNLEKTIEIYQLIGNDHLDINIADMKREVKDINVMIGFLWKQRGINNPVLPQWKDRIYEVMQDIKSS